MLFERSASEIPQFVVVLGIAVVLGAVAIWAILSNVGTQGGSIADWIDSNDWNQMDYREIGRGVNADMVLGLDLTDLRLHEGQTLYQGRVTLTATVYDMQDNGKVVFRRTIPDFTFPRNGPRHATEMTEARFRSLFVEVLSKHVAKYFCAYDFEEDFAQDARNLAG